METVDAMQQPRQWIHPSSALDQQVLRRLEEDMDMYEKVSCLFLILQDYKLGYKTFVDCGKNSSTMISNFIKENTLVDWEDKVVEALCLLQNHEILHKLGISHNDVQTIFATKHPEIPHKINKWAKALFHLFDNFSKDDTNRILDRVYPRELPPPDYSAWPDENSLEIHMLWWIHVGYIVIRADKWKLKNFLKVLKELKLTKTDAYETLEKWNLENDSNISHCDDQLNNNLSTPQKFEKDNARSISNEAPKKYKIQTGLVIVFNQVEFPVHTTWEHRSGSKEDCDQIKETFEQTIGFEVKVHDNFHQKQIYAELDSLSKLYEKYDCVVVFILSHGTWGNIISSDGVECPIDKIQDKICCVALTGKPKILVIQACQSRALTTDGGNESNLDNRFQDFVQFNSTIQGKKSIRDPRNGTWFVQTLCKVLKERTPQGWSFEDCAKEINNHLSIMQARINGSLIKQVPISSSTLRKTLILPNRASRGTSESRA